MEYTTLVSQIAKAEGLMDSVNLFNSSHEALNLITPEWKKHLENNLSYQKFVKNAKGCFKPEKISTNSFRVQQMHGNPFKVILAGYCNVYSPYTPSTKKQPFAITLLDNSALNVICKTLTSDVDHRVELTESCKLNFASCNMYCKYCSNALEDMTKLNITVPMDCGQPCILDTYIYDGKRVVNRFASQIKDLFSGSFLAIVQIDFNVRYRYTTKEDSKEKIRIGGNIVKMIAFPESNLMTETKLVLGDLSLLVQSPEDDCVDFYVPPVLKREVSENEEEIVDINPPARKLRKTVDVVEETFNI